MKHLLYCISLLAGCHAVWSCSEDIMSRTQTEYPGMTAAEKIVNSAADAVSGTLLIYADNGLDGLASADSIFSLIGVTAAERVFPDTEGTAKSSGGVGNWHVVTFDPQCSLEDAAVMLASIDGVSKVQYNTRLLKASDCLSWPYTKSSAAASSEATAFNDPMLGSQWNYRNTGSLQLAPTARAGADINVTDAWRLTGGDPRVIVAVLDEGIEYSHPDLAANMWVNEDEIPGDGIDNDGNGYIDDCYGYNFVTGNGALSWNRPGDSGHATHIAGTIAAVNGNGSGVCGIAGGTGNGDGVRIMSCMIFDGNSGGDILTCARAIKYAADNGASIISGSFGYAGGTYSTDSEFINDTEGIETDAIDYFLSSPNTCGAVNGGIAIFASGNELYPMASYPGAYTGCISVSAIACDNLPAFYTNYGPGCDICAPGGERYTGGQDNEVSCILSTMPSESFNLYDGQMNFLGTTAAGYGYMEGTSMACPHVSGVAALGLSYALALGKTYTRDEFISLLLTSVTGIDGLLEGSKTTLTGSSLGTLPLAPFKYGMGSGLTDAWRLLMQIEGTPCLTVRTGELSEVSLDRYLGGNAAYIIGGCSVKVDDPEALGLTDEPEFSDGKLRIFPTKTGSSKVTLSYFVGGSSSSSTDSPSGIPVTREISVLSRAVVPDNGGWL